MKVYKIGLVFLFGLAVLLWQDVMRSFSYELAVLDVGQGDSIFIRSPLGHQIIIDGGRDKTVLKRLSEQMPFWDKSVDLIVLTHPEADHIAGLNEVLKYYTADTILWTGMEKDTKEVSQWKRHLADQEHIVIADAGQTILVPGTLLSFEVLHPAKESVRDIVKINNTSIVLKAVFPGAMVLLTGDIEKEAEEELLSKDIQADILKVAHHGSKTSTSRRFLEAVSPSEALISVGARNQFGHPVQSVLEVLTQYGISIHRTDKEGTISFSF